MKIELQGRRALVTGGGGQLGRGISRTLAACGADVALTYHRTPEAAEAVAQEIGGRALPLDVTQPESFAVLDKTLGIWRPDIVVANSVVQYTWKPILEQDMSDFESQYRSCVEHLVLLAKTFAPAMRDKGYGRIVAINTECAMLADAGSGAYVAGKRGMDGIVRVLAKELGPSGITVNQVAPGWMQSDRIRAMDHDVQSSYRETVPLRMSGTEEDIAAAVAFFASDHARFVTGAYLPVCGGRVMAAI